MQVFRIIAALAVILLSTTGTAALERVQVGDVIGNPVRYRDVRVKLMGQVTKTEVNPASLNEVTYTLQDSSGHVIRVKTLSPPELDSWVYVVGTVLQDDAASKPYLIEIKHGPPGPPLSILIGSGVVLVAAALVLAYFMFIPRPVPKKHHTAKNQQTQGVERRPVITQVYRDDPVAMLIAVSGPHRGEVFRLYGGANTIGRDDNQTVQLSEDTTVSRRHARIDANDGALLIVNESSTNPTRVAGQDVEKRELSDGDIIQIGSTRLKVSIVSGE
ncbi:MAG: FHA domain-containing protein [Armatimonadetes bacterium]|nr:FHA domain-containing protein [Armatimonadota bacterium]